MILVVYGPEGSGKGTQAKLLGEKLDLPVVTTGDLVREAAASDRGEIGRKAKAALLGGKYLSDEDVCALLKGRFESEEAKKGFILDGFPRTLAQAQYLIDLFGKNCLKLDRFIYLKLSEEESLARLIKRKRRVFGSSGVLHDDPERIKKRLSIYRQQETQILAFFKEKNLLLIIDGNQTIEDVFNDILVGLKVNP